jgi:hypothetical protein
VEKMGFIGKLPMDAFILGNNMIRLWKKVTSCEDCGVIVFATLVVTFWILVIATSI